MENIRFGILGCGKIAKKFADAVRASKGVSLTAAASRSEERAKAFAAENGIPAWYGDYSSMLGSGRIDAVYIATVNSAHFDNIMLALEHGIPVLCEKPMVLSVSDFDRIAAKAREKETLVMEAMWSVFLPSMVKIKSLLEQKAIGVPQLGYINFCVNFPKDPHSRIYDPSVGGGLIFDIGVYNLHTAFFLFGHDFDRFAVCGQKGVTGVDVRSQIALAYPDGLLLNTVTADVETPSLLRLYGTAGSIQSAEHYNSAQSFTLLQNGKEPLHLDCPISCNGFEYEIQEFAGLLREGKTESRILPLRRSRRVCEVMEKAHQIICG